MKPLRVPLDKTQNIAEYAPLLLLCNRFRYLNETNNFHCVLHYDGFMGTAEVNYHRSDDDDNDWPFET